jgi:hypothetical protein
MQQFTQMPGAGPGKFPENPQPAIRFRQGKRVVTLIVPTLDQVGNLAAPVDPKEDPEAIYDLLEEPEPEGRIGRNRMRNTGHIKGIAKYLAESDKWVLGSLVTVARPGKIRYTTMWEFDSGRSVGYVEAGKYEEITEVTDGGHRVGGIGIAVDPKNKNNPRWMDLVNSGIPVMIVEEEDPTQAGQDFAALAQTRPISSSLRDALDTRSPINSFFLNLSRELTLTGKGERVEYMSNSVGANSEKLLPFYAFKFVGSQFMVGRRYRSPKAQDEAVNEILAADGAAQLWHDRLARTFEYAGKTLPGWKQVVEGALTVPEARRDFISISTVGMTAFMLALHGVAEQEEGVIKKAIDRLARLDWGRTDSSVLYGTVINSDVTDPSKIVTSISRNGFENGADKLVEHLGDLMPAAA